MKPRLKFNVSNDLVTIIMSNCDFFSFSPVSSDFLTQLLNLYKDVKYCSLPTPQPCFRLHCGSLDELFVHRGKKRYFPLLVIKRLLFLMLTFPDVSLSIQGSVWRLLERDSSEVGPLSSGAVSLCNSVEQSLAVSLLWTQPLDVWNPGSVPTPTHPVVC